MKLILFEDNQCENLRPVGLFSPLFEVHVGSWTLLRLVQTLDYPVITIIREHFLDDNLKNPDIAALAGDSLFFLNASIEPDARYLNTIRDLARSGDPFITTSGNRVAAALVGPDTTIPEAVSSGNISALLLELGLPLEQELFNTIDWPHEVVRSHLRLFGSNLDFRISNDTLEETSPGIFLGKDTVLNHTCAFNNEKGIIAIDSKVILKPFTYLEGPVYIGNGSRIIEHSAIKDHTSVGNGCKIGGEIEASTIEPHSNKQHHGFLGHSWIGRWVNLGAGTTTSDLKNTYGKVRMDYGGTRVETEMQFLGSIIGDFAKTAVNTLLFTGKIIGVSSMVYGMVTTNVPSFTNYVRSFGQVTGISLEQALTTQKRMYNRRGVEQTPYDVKLMKRVFEMTRNERFMSDEQIIF